MSRTVGKREMRLLARDRIAGLDPRIHAPSKIIDVGVSQVGQGFCRDVASVAGLAVHHDVLVQRHPDFPMTGLDLSKIDIEIGAGDEPPRMLFRRTNINEHKALFRH